MAAVLLASLTLALAVLLAVDRHFRRRRAHAISLIGRPARMHYAAVDRFGLTERLIAEPGWERRAPGIDVKDVLYASAGGERCFILTVKSRPSPDLSGQRTLVRVVERASDNATLEIVARTSRDAHADAEVYHELIEGWLARHPALRRAASAAKAQGA